MSLGCRTFSSPHKPTRFAGAPAPSYMQPIHKKNAVKTHFFRILFTFAGYALTYSDKVVPSRDTSSKVACKLKLTYEFGLPHFLLSPQTHEVCGGPSTILYAAHTQEKCSKNTLFSHFSCVCAIFVVPLQTI